MESECLVKGFWAPSNIGLCEKFSEGHQNVLKEHGYEHLKSNNTDWYQDKGTYVILATIESKPVGGLRFVKKRKDQLLPMEKAIYPLDEKIENYFKSIEHLESFEICGLWNSRVVGGQNLSSFLSRLGLVMAPHFNWDVSLCFMATYTFRIPRRLGYTIVTDFGDKGYFNYPTKQFQAAVWGHSEILELGNCVNSEKERVLSLRENRFQIYREENNKGGILIRYELNL